MPRFPSHEPKPSGDPRLAEFMRKHDVQAPVEQIEYVDWLATSLNREKLGDIRKRIVKLACGHFETTRNRTKCPCSQCHAMILNGEDYAAFRGIAAEE